MKRKIRLLAVLLVATTLSVFAQPDFSNEKIIESEQIKFQAAHLAQTSNALNNYDIIYNRCYWHADPAVNYIKGSVLTSFIAGANMNFIEFDFSPVLTVDSVVFHNTSLPFSLTAGDVLQISFPATLAAGTLDSVTVYYQGAPQSSGFGAYVQTTHNNTPVIWTLSEPYGAKSWWPCKQTLNDKIDSIDIIITTPSVYRAGSNGVLVSETVNGSDAVYHWSHRYPIAAYLVAFAVTNYAVYTDLAVVGNDTIEILNYVYPESLAVHQSATPAAIGAMQLFDSLFTPYPFANEKYGHAEIGGGASMEHQTMSFMSSASINHHVLSHELAHQWFGDQVTCGSWEDIWLNEGFASYGTGLTYQYMFGGQWWQPWKIQNVQNITSLPGGSVFCTDTTTVSRIFDGRLSYAKGAYFLHMLRWVVGDSAFFAGVKNYLNDTLLSYGYARTADFKSHMEAASGLTLTEFFYDWFYGEGHPSYLLTWGQDTLNNLSLTLSQTQSHPSVSFFEMPVPVRFANSVQDTVLVLNHTFSGQAFSAGINFKADSAFVDPELWIVSANNVVTNVADLKTDELVVQVKPNPFQSMLDIRVNSAFSGKINFELMNSLGQRVPVTVTSLNKSEYRLELTEDIPPGVYFIRCNNDENSFSKDVLKQ